MDRRTPRRGIWAATLALAAGLAGAAPPAAVPPAADPYAAEPFLGDGLTRAGPVLVLAPAEADVRGRVKALRAAKGKLSLDAAARRDFDRRRQGLLNQIADLDAAFAQVNAARLRAKQGTHEYDRLGDQNNLLIAQQDRAAEALRALDKQGEKMKDTRSDFLRLGVEACDAGDDAATRYADLAADPDVAAALRQANAGLPPGRAVRVGPSPELAVDLKYLAACRADLATTVVPVTFEGGVPNVDVILNGREHVRMIWDSGATLVSLSAGAAADAGLRPSAADRTVESRIANGQRVTEHLISLDSVQVGSFVAHDVECTVGNANEGSPPLLLGDSFQNQFLSRLDQAAGKLYLTPIRLPGDQPKAAAAAGDRRVSTAKPTAAPPPAGGFRPGLLGEMYADNHFGKAARTRVDRQLYFEWRTKAIEPSIWGDKYSAEWAGLLRVRTGGTYKFWCDVDDRVVVRIDGATVIARQDVSADPARGEADLQPGLHRIEVAYVNVWYEGHLMLKWQPPGGTLEQIPAWALVHRAADEPAGLAPPVPGWRTDLVGGGPHDGTNGGPYRAGGDPFRDDAPPGAVLVGLELTDREYLGHRVLRSALPLYRGPAGDAAGHQWGGLGEHFQRVVARPGYAVASVATRGGDCIDSLALRFARVLPDGTLSATDAYDAPACGGDTDGAVPLGNGKPIVGVYGVIGDSLSAVGFVNRD